MISVLVKRKQFLFCFVCSFSWHWMFTTCREKCRSFPYDMCLPLVLLQRRGSNTFPTSNYEYSHQLRWIRRSFPLPWASHQKRKNNAGSWNSACYSLPGNWIDCHLNTGLEVRRFTSEQRIKVWYFQRINFICSITMPFLKWDLDTRITQSGYIVLT